MTGLFERTRKRLDLTASAVSLLRYDNQKDSSKCTDVLLLMNVETVLRSEDAGSRFSVPRLRRPGLVAGAHPCTELEDLKKEKERRDWISAHLRKIEETDWSVGVAVRRR